MSAAANLVADQAIRTNPPQFDNSLLIASTAHVQREKGNFSGLPNISASTLSIAATDMGKVYGVTVSCAVTLPLANSVPAGAAVKLFFTSTGTIAVTGGAAMKTGASVGAVPNAPTSLAVNGGFADCISDGTSWWVLGSTTLGNVGGFASSFAVPGYQKLPSGLLVQFGNASASTSGVTGSFATTFPNNVLSMSVFVLAANSSVPAVGGTPTTTGFTLYSSSGTPSLNYLAIGY